MNINPTIFNIIRWFAGSPGQMTRRPSIWCSKYHFFIWFSIDLGHSKLFIFCFYKFIKKKYELNWNFFAKNFAWNCKKEKYFEHQTLGWWVICPRNSVLYCRLSDFMKTTFYSIDLTVSAHLSSKLLAANQIPTSVSQWFKISDLVH